MNKKIVNAFALTKKSFLQSFDQNLIKSIALAYLVSAGGTIIFSSLEADPINMPLFIFSYIWLIFGPLIFFPILMEGLRANERKSNFIFPNVNLILKKSWKIFAAGIIPSIFIFLGTLCFIIPGILIAKRYIYVSFIAEKEMIGPLASMEKSRVLSQKNGWSIIIAYFIASICLMILWIPYLFIISLVSYELYPFLSIIIGWFASITFNTIGYYGYLNAEKS